MRHVISIEAASNGFIVYGTNPNTGKRMNILVEEDETIGDGDLKALQRMLWVVLEQFGYYGSKHAPERIIITTEKRECFDEEQEDAGHECCKIEEGRNSMDGQSQM